MTNLWEHDNLKDKLVLGTTECGYNRQGAAWLEKGTCDLTGAEDVWCVAIDSSADEYGAVQVSIEYIINEVEKVDKHWKK